MNIENAGTGVLLNLLEGGEETVKTWQGSLGKTIASLSMKVECDKFYDKDVDVLHFAFTDGTRIKVWDDGQSCCEQRYMQTDDNLSDYIGAQLLGGEVRDAPGTGDEYEVHEVQFFVVKTSKGQFTMCTHNEHNGYYGGFDLKVAPCGDQG